MIPEFKDKMTIGEKYDPAMTITDPEEAKQYFELAVKHTMSKGRSRKEAEEIERSNLGYYAGYCSNETRLRVEKLFCCQHPVFGLASEGVPTAEEAFEMGVEFSSSNPPQE